MRLPPDPAEWSRLTHEQLYAQIRTGPGSAAALAAQDLWAGAGEVLEAGHARITAALTVSGDGWTGAAADAARGGLTPLTDWALAAVDDARVTVAAVVAQGDHAERLRTLMPPPNTADVQAAQAAVEAAPPRFGPVTQLPRLDAAQAQAQSLADDAFRLMRGYADSSDRNVVDLDRWSVPPAVTVDATLIGPAGRPVPVSRVVGGRRGASIAGGGEPAAATTTGPARTAVPATRAGEGGGEPAAATTTGPAGTAVPAAGAGQAGVGSAAVRTDPGAVPSGTAAPPSTAGAATLLPGYGGRGSRPDSAGPGGRPSAGVIGSVPGGRWSGPGTAGGPAASTGRSPLGAPGPAPRRPAAWAGWADEPPLGRPGGGAGIGDAGGRPGVIGSHGVGGGTGPNSRWPGTLGLGGGTGSTTRWPDGSGSTGGEARSAARWAAEPGSGATAAEPATTGRSTTASSHTGLYPPMMGGGRSGQEEPHRRPDWLVDDSGAFEDHRWFPPAVIGPDDPLPPSTT